MTQQIPKVLETRNDPTDVMLKFIKSAVELGGAAFQKPEYHGLFEYGTVVRFQIDNECKFPGFLTDYYEFPKHRLRDETKLSEFLNDNEKTYKKTLEKYPQYAAIIKTAYDTLIGDGYPYPGGEGADRTILPLPEPNTGLVFFPHRNIYLYQCIAPSLFNDVPEGGFSLDQMTYFGGETRRSDYMVPKLVSFISPTLEVVRLEHSELS